MNEKEARRILDVAPNATLQECKKSMIKQQKAFHPNFAKNDDQREVFTRKSQEVNDAYSYIKTLLEKRTQKKLLFWRGWINSVRSSVSPQSRFESRLRWCGIEC